MFKLVEAVAPVIAARTDLPYAVFGASAGAFMGFEVVRWMRRHGQRLPDTLFVAAAPAPHLPRSTAPLHALSDDELIATVGERYGALPRAVLADPSLRSMVLRTLRADLSCLEGYEYAREEMLTVPIHAYGGTLDVTTSRASLEAWRAQTSCGATIDLLPGGHFFFESPQSKMLDLMASAL